MRQYSLFIDNDPNLSGALMVRESGGAVRLAQRTEILAVARELVSVDELRNNDLSEPAKVKSFLRLRLAGLEHEVCGLILLDNRMHLITYLEPFRGTLNEARAYPREVLKLVLRYNAAAVMLVHNHPSGVAEASTADIRFTQLIRNALALIDVRLVDHLIVAGAKVISMVDAGLI
ncbi:JAB domain-containing protein [Bordetella petrii]|uniref:JAB domain-containing protein n=1 Tax=Bordetella petrii TaxID=94624 RepID=UPI00047DC1C9|nr:JAB domain-containing protein [Bordetella petrii]